MRLHRIEIVGEYKSIKGTVESPFTYSFKKSSGGYSPLCLVGLNGSGKSNFIELIADIFGYADRYFNEQYQCEKDLRYDFELIYFISGGSTTRTVQLKCESSILKMFELNIPEDCFVTDDEGTDQFTINLAVQRLVTSNQHEMLPTNVITYSSGHNQGLSSVFAKTAFQSFEVLRQQGVFYREYKPRYDKVMAEQDAENDAAWEGVSKYVTNTYNKKNGLFKVPRAYEETRESYFKFPEEPLEPTEFTLPMGLFTDHSLNNLFFIYLMSCRGVNKSKSKAFRRFALEQVNISGLLSFDIDLRLNEYREFETIENIVRRLTELSCESLGQPLPPIGTDISLSPKLHFKLGRDFLKGMERLYLDETVLLEHLLTLHHLTAKRWSNDEKNVLKSSRYIRNVPNVSGGLMPMRIWNIQVKLEEPNVKTTYDRISDGEHQLIQIISSLILFEHQQSLFILDEPESHFNPEWRIEFIELLNKYVKLDNLELMVSTHSPFILSACKSDRVLHFEKDESSKVTVNSIGLETYGASFDSLLTSVFDLDVLISKKPLAEIRAGLKAFDDALMDESETLKWLERFGESFELNYRRNKIRQSLSADYEGEN